MLTPLLLLLIPFFLLLSYTGTEATLRLPVANPDKSGKAPFVIPSNGVVAETFYAVFGDLHSLDSGQVPLVVGHGGGAGGTHHYLKSLSYLAYEHSIPIILYDQLGFGLSSHFPDQAGNTSFWTVDLLVKQLYQLLKFLKIENRYDYLGHSFGALLGIELASREALRMGLRKMILCSPVASMKLADAMFRKRREMLPKDILETLQRHEKDGTTESEEYRKAITASQHMNFCRLDIWPEELLESLSYSSQDVDAALTLFGDNPLDTKGTTADWSALEIAQKITAPTLLMNGHWDWSDEATEPLFWEIPVVEWITFSNSSHMLHLEEKELFMDTVSKWLDGTEENLRNILWVQ